MAELPKSLTQSVTVFCGVPVWSQAQAQLQEAVKGERGGDRKSDEIKRRAVANDPTAAANGHPTDRKSRLIRTLTNLKEDPEACKSKGTTPEKVQVGEKSQLTIFAQAQTSDPITTPTATESEFRAVADDLHICSEMWYQWGAPALR